MNANVSDSKEQDAPLDSATQEKIREFCYELALALRRITGRVVDDKDLSLPEDLGGSDPAKPTDTQEK